MSEGPSPTSEAGSNDTEPQGEKDNGAKSISPISADTPISIVFESPPKLTKKSLKKQDEAMQEPGDAAERLRWYAYSSSPISSQIPRLGWCCNHFGSIVSILSCIVAFLAGGALLYRPDNTHIAILMIGGFFIFLGWVMLAWFIREVLFLYAKKKFIREQRERQFSHVGSQASTSRHIEETELTAAVPPAEGQSSSGQVDSQPSTSQQYQDTETAASTPTEPPTVTPETPESTNDEPTSTEGKGKYPPKGDYKKGKLPECYLETDI